MSLVTLEELVKAQPYVAQSIGILPTTTVRPLNALHKSAYTRGRELVAERVWTDEELKKSGSFVVYLDYVAHKDEAQGFHDELGLDLLEADMRSIVVTHPELGSRLLKIAPIYDEEGIPFASQYCVKALPDPMGS